MMYDENEDWGDHRSAMIRFALNLATGKEIEIHKGGLRGWLHVSDAIRAIEASSRVSDYQIINIGHPDLRSIEELAEKIRFEMNASKSLLNFIDLPGKMTLSKNPKLDKQKNILGITPKVSFDDGIKLVCDKVKQIVMSKK